jgi:cytochrome bd-type quinol oxidase subunit 1
MADLSVVDLSRLQFAIATLFNILWPVLSISLSLFLVVTESLWLRTGEVAWYPYALLGAAVPSEFRRSRCNRGSAGI